jgi:hypothetical protein
VEISAQFRLLHSASATSPFVGSPTRKRLTGKRFSCDCEMKAKRRCGFLSPC